MTDTTPNCICDPVLAGITTTPTPVEHLIQLISDSSGVDRREAVARLWDLIDDEDLIYAADATVRRKP